MSKYSKYQRKSPPGKQTHPVWRGIGCLLILFVPMISYGIGYLLLQEAKRLSIVPFQLLGYIHFPEWVIGVPFLSTMARFLGGFKDLGAKLVFFLVTLFILAGLVSLIYSAIYQAIGPSRYTELDAPPTGKKSKEYKR
jgi:hypothetical protein